jgi:histidinol-phosphate aminotransferase
MTYRYDNIITLRTFSKAYGLAGLRIGYGFAHDELIRNLMKVKEPFSPSLIAQTAGSAAMDDSAFLEKTLTINETGYTFLQKELTSLGIETVPSVANFITSIWETNAQALDITQSLLKKGIIVRNLKAFGWPNCIRISIGTADENGRFIDALKFILSN